MKAGADAAEPTEDASRRPAFIQLAAGKTVTVGRSTASDVVIPHSSVSRQHARLTRQEDQTWLEDLDASHGTYVNDAPVRKIVLRPGDFVRFGSGPTYRFTGESLSAEDAVGGMQVELVKMDVDRGGKNLLEGVCVSIAPGSFAGILGPSGSGKSTLLHCLASTESPTRGEVLFDDGRRVLDTLDDYRAMIGVVTQADLVYASLTVEENLRFSAQLRLPMADKTEIDRRVRGAIELVDLERHVNERVEKLSGGERKRAGVAIELLLRPRLLLLDEPTSGLDPSTAAEVMGVLRRLSRQGTTVVCTTHTTETLHFFDTAVVLGKQAGVGRIAFDGAPGELMPAFGVQNAADLFDRLRSLDGSRVEVAGTRTKLSPGTHSTARLCQAPSRRPPEGWSLTRQTRIVAYRSMLGFRRDRANFMLAFIQPLILALVVVFSQHNQPRSIFIQFFLITSALWLGMTLTVREAVRERALYVRDRIASLSPDAFIAGKLSYALAVCCAQSIILGVAARLLVCAMIPATSFTSDMLKGSWVLALAVFTLCSFGGAVIGLVISVMASSERAAVAMLPLAILPQMLLSRVSFGDGAQPWATTSSPFGPVIDMARYLRSDDATFLGGLESICSLPLLSRPGTAVLDLPYQQGVTLSVLGVEWLYCALLLLAYLLVLYLLFRAIEPKWQLAPRS